MVLCAVSLAVGGAAHADVGTDPDRGPGPGHAAGSAERRLPAVTRVSGANRYELAARAALLSRPAGAPVVYVAAGANFPDALSAGPAVMAAGGALLLVPPDVVPTAVLDTLQLLGPSRVVVVGGPLSVPDAVVSQLASVVPGASFTRVAGADRYAVSRAIAAQAFPGGAATSLVATGASFPDALSAGAPAGTLGAPVVLVNGALPSVDLPTWSALRSLGTSSIVVVGGPASVPPSLEGELAGIAPVTRIAGVDRYAASVAINDALLADFGTVYLATGLTFPDALAGGVLAGTQRHPLYLVPGTCVPNAVLQRLSDRGTTRVVLLGGPLSLTPAVESLTPCP